jgi:hypothetical protein
MVLAQSIIGTAIVSSPASPLPAGTYTFNGATLSFPLAFGIDPVYPKLTSYSFPNETQSNTIEITNGSWQLTNSMGALDNFYINFWFYPSSYNRAILSELNGPTPGYYYNVMEIDSSGYVKAGVYTGAPMAYVTSPNKVIVDAWNHIYFYYNAGTIHLELNGGVAATLGSVSRSGPDSSYFAFGFDSATNMGSSSPYWGYLDGIAITNYSVSSSYSSTKAKYQAQPVFALLANTYTSNGTWTDTIASKAFTLYNNPTYSATNGGQIRFHASNAEYGDTGTGNSLSSLTSFTIQGVFKVHTASQALAPCLITEGWPGTSKINYTIGYVNGSNQIDAGFFDGNAGYWNVLTAKSSPSTDVWYDVVCSYYAPTKELKVYLDGNIVTSTIAPGTAGSDNMGIRIARRWDDAQYFDSTIKDINIWSGVMTPSEIASQHTPYSSLV